MLNNIAKSSGTVLVLSFIGTVIGYLLRLFLARNLSVSDYGLFYAVLVFVGFFATFRDPDLSTALTKFVPEFMARKQLGRVKASIIFVALVQIIMGIIIVFPIFSFANYIALNFFGTAAAAIPLQIISLSFFVSIIMSVLQTSFQGIGKMFYYAVVEPLRLFLAFVIAAILISMGVIGAAYGYLIAPIVVSVILFIGFLRSFPFLRVKADLDKTLIKKILLFALTLFAGGLGSIALRYMDTIILTAYRSLYEVGLYQAALPTSQLLWFFIGGIGSVLLPTVSGLWGAGRKGHVSDVILILTKILFMVIVPLAVLFVAFPEIILRILFGESFTAASQSLQVLSIGAIFYTFFFMFGLILIAIGKPSSYIKVLLSTGAVGVVLNFSLTPSAGIIGAASATALSYVFGFFFAMFSVKKFVTIKVPVAGILKALLGGVIVLVLVYSVKTITNFSPFVEILLSAALSLIAYTLFAVRFIMNKSDLRILSAIGIRLPKAIDNWLIKVLK